MTTTPTRPTHDGRYVAIAAATLAFAVLLTVALTRLFQIERQMDSGSSETLLWSLLAIIASVIGILASGFVLILDLVHSLRRTAAAERALREDTDFLHLLLDSSGEGIMAIDREMRVTHWNSGMTRLLGIPADAIVGAVFTDVLQMPDDHPVAAALHRTLEGHNGYLPENPLPGSDRIVEKASFPLRSGGTIIGGLAFIRDVTERIHAQRALAGHLDELERQVQDRTKDLRETEWQLRSAINTAPDGFAAFDAQGRLVLANTRARDLFPTCPTLFDPGSWLPDVLSRTRIPLAASADGLDAGEELRTGELQLATGTWLQATLRSSAEGSSVLRLVDVTSYKQAALTLEKALARERNLRELYKNFVTMVSHQFRTPLAIIDSGAQRMLRRSADMDADEITNRTGKIRTAALRLTRLVEGTLDAARFDAGQIDFHPKAYDFGRLVRDVCDRQRELNPRRTFHLSLDSLPQSIVCDPLLLDQVIANLVSNASKYSPDSEPIVVSAAVNAEAVELTIRDRGIGIPDDEIPRLFERFFRASTAAGIEGTGIGLHVAREIARMHDGDISVETREGEGSAFTLRLPLLTQRTGLQSA